MDSLRFLNSDRDRGVAFLVALLVSLFSLGLQADAGNNPASALDAFVQIDQQNHSGEIKSTGSRFIRSVYSESGFKDPKLFDHKNGHFIPTNEKSIPPAQLRSDNRPAGEDERKLHPHLLAPFPNSDTRLSRALENQPQFPGHPLLKAPPLQHLSTIVLLN